MVCRVNDLTTSGENSCVTVDSREGGRINVLGERSLERRFSRRLTLHDVNENICFAANGSSAPRSHEGFHQREISEPSEIVALRPPSKAEARSSGGRIFSPDQD